MGSLGRPAAPIADSCGRARSPEALRTVSSGLSHYPETKRRSVRSGHDRHLDARSEGLGPENALGSGDVIRVFGFENVLDVPLRIAVNHGEPGALNLRHDPVALLKAMIFLVQVDVKFRDLV